MQSPSKRFKKTEARDEEGYDFSEITEQNYIKELEDEEMQVAVDEVDASVFKESLVCKVVRELKEVDDQGIVWSKLAFTREQYRHRR